MALTPKRQRFVEEYLIDGNATQAAIRAGYKADNAKQTGSEVLTFPDVQAALAKARSERVKRTGITADWVLTQQASLHAQTVGDEPEIARKTLRDIGDGIGMYVEQVAHTFPELPADERTNRLASIFNGARTRKAATNGNGSNGNGKH